MQGRLQTMAHRAGGVLHGNIAFHMIQFRAPEAVAPDGSIIGVISEGRFETPATETTVLGPGDAIPSEPGSYILEHTLALASARGKAEAVARLLSLRRRGATFVLISHDETLLESCADEIWWVRDGAMLERGDPGEVLGKYRAWVAAELRSRGSGRRVVVSPAIRNGDGRASLTSIELLDERGEPTVVWRSGENAAIRVTAQFEAAVEDPVIGIMIRTRIGLNVYGTNTELAGIHAGPMQPGDTLRVVFRFNCDLCPGDYTVTAASHDPDGVWHDWMEDAVAFSVADSRYAAGVANLRARVSVEQ
jgi:lipopolysaccharide transport system ATP-binding protein